MKKFPGFMVMVLYVLLVYKPGAFSQYKPSSLLYGTDILVESSANCNYANTRIAVANNGWISVLMRLDTRVKLKLSQPAWYTLSINSIMGKEIINKTFSGTECTLPLGDIPAGVYMVKISGNGKDLNKKLVVD